MQGHQADVSPRASVEERLKAGDRRFSKLEQRLEQSDASTKRHLQQQDGEIETIKAIVARIDQNTSSIVETWNDGARAVRFFCRLAQAWRFLLRQVAIPVVIPLFAAYAGLYYAAHGHFPPWLADTVKLILAIV
ncbi:hypothetical protein P5W99_24320 [Paraburkholderia sp. A3BS-1L]|uniref:hypothetical protein n=1 Tax=Paraburkholderia sp. A3BS-1L TaxID=3028375 RepID=UPI003DA7FCCE